MALGAVAGPRQGASGMGALGTQAEKDVSRQRGKIQPRQTAPGNPSGRPYAPAGMDGGEATTQQWTVGELGVGGGLFLFSHTYIFFSFMCTAAISFKSLHLFIIPPFISLVFLFLTFTHFSVDSHVKLRLTCQAAHVRSADCVGTFHL